MMRFKGGDEISLKDIIIITSDMAKLKNKKLKEDKALGDDGIMPNLKTSGQSNLT